MSASSHPVRHIPKSFPANLTGADIQRMRAMVIERRPIPEIAKAFRTSIISMEYYLRDRRRQWLNAYNEGRVEFLPEKTVIYRRRSGSDGGFVVLPYSVAPVSLHRQVLAEKMGATA